MKLTESMLRRMIREEASKLVEMGRMGYIGPGIKTASGTGRDANESLRDISAARRNLNLANLKMRDQNADQARSLAASALNVFLRFPSTCGSEIKAAADLIARAAPPSPEKMPPEEMSPSEEMPPEEMFESRRLRRRR